MSSLFIRNGRVIDPATGFDGVRDLAIANGSFAREAPEGAPVFDATGLIVAPGFIDMHVHLREPGAEHAETIESGARAAAAGGFTTVCCMPNTTPVNDNATVTSYIVSRARQKAIVNVLPIGAITKGSAGEELAAFASMKKAGIVAISDDGRPVMNSRVMRRAMEFARSLDLPVIDHCEDLNLSAGGDMHEGAVSTRLGLRGIPSTAEDVMVARDILLAQATGARYHVAHISTQNAVRMVEFAKLQGLPVTAETTPHHFVLTDSGVGDYDSNFKMKPPLRGTADVEAVIQGIVSGAIDVIATDHAPHAGNDKMQEFERCPFGITGLETALALSLQALVEPGLISLLSMVRLFTTGPARVLGLGCGNLEEGRPGDVTVFDPDARWTYDVNASASKSRNSPFHGRELRGRAIATIVNGVIVYRAGC